MVIAQNVSGALHLKDALHRESILEIRLVDFIAPLTLRPFPKGDGT